MGTVMSGLSIGFTGTREGLTRPQSMRLHDWLIDCYAIDQFHHGCCVGADTEAHHLAFWCNPRPVIHAHPPIDTRLMNAAVRDDSAVIHEAKPYHDRNRDIVNACYELIACPKEMTEQARGGTWMTVRYAREIGRAYFIIWPDGSTSASRP